MKYRIGWTSKLTGKTGQGTTLFSRSEAEKIVETLNDENGNFFIHEMVLADEMEVK